MTTTLFDHTAEPCQDGGFFTPNGDLMRYIDIVRLILWLWQMLRRLIKILHREDKAPPRTVPPSLSRNEFGYIDMNGAY